MMRVVVIGAVRFTRCCLDALVADPRRGSAYAVVGVVTTPIASERHSDAADLADAARALDAPLLRTASTRDDATVAAIAAWRPDLILVLGWSQLLDERLLSLPRLGCIGSHPAPLPLGRGRHPLVWSILLGWPGTLSLFQLAAGADTGALWLQRPFAIGPQDHATEAYEAMSAAGAGMVVELLTGITAGTLAPVEQDHARATVLRKRTADDGIIRGDRTAAENHALVRALAAPYPGAVARLTGGEVRCWRVAPLTGGPAGGPPGTVLACAPDRLVIACADADLVVSAFDAPVPPRPGELLSWPAQPPPSPFVTP